MLNILSVRSTILLILVDIGQKKFKFYYGKIGNSKFQISNGESERETDCRFGLLRVILPYPMSFINIDQKIFKF